MSRALDTLRKMLGRLDERRLELAIEARGFTKGDTPGHEFRGNQYTGGAGGASRFDEHGDGKTADTKGTHVTEHENERLNNAELRQKIAAHQEGHEPDLAAQARRDLVSRANPKGERRFITDTGKEQDITDASTGKKVGTLPRYAVWGDKGRGKPEVLETHGDLERMMAEHGVPKDRVVSLPSHKQGLAEWNKVEKGDVSGHAFHGNQYTAGQTVRFEGQSADGKVSGGMDVKIVNPHSNADKVTHTDKSGRQYEGASRHLPTATVQNARGTTFEAHHFSLQAKKA